MTSRLVSIIVRSMNRKTLRKSLQSLAIQNYPRLEVLVINATGRIHSSLSEKCGAHPLRVIENPGVPLARSAAANLGLDSASGEMVLFLDDDDYIYSEHIANLVGALEENVNCIAAYSATECVDAEDLPLAQSFGDAYDKTRLMSGNYIPIHSLLFRRNPTTAECRFDNALDLYEDWDFWLQLAEKGYFFYLPQKTAVYRIDSTRGFGVNGWGSAEAKAAMQILQKKWIGLWSSNDIYALMERTREINNDLAQHCDQLQAYAENLQQHCDQLQGYADSLLADNSKLQEHCEQLQAYTDNLLVRINGIE